MKNRHRKKTTSYSVDEYGRITNRGYRNTSNATNMIVDLLAMADVFNDMFENSDIDESTDATETEATDE